LGRKTGAGIVIFGAVAPHGKDSVWIVAALLERATGKIVGEVEIRDGLARMDDIQTSLTLGLLADLGRTRSIGVVSPRSLGSHSLPAVKAFLQGEAYFRRTAWDSALAYYDRAAELDSNFTLVFLRRGLVASLQGSDSAWLANALRAGRLNRGLPNRESLMVAAESLRAALGTGLDAEYWSHRRRLFGTLEAATARYPRDAETWYLRGEAKYLHSSPLSEALSAYQNAIALDSAFAPSYIHAAELAALVQGPGRARAYLDAYLALKPVDAHADGIRLARLMLDTARSSSLLARRVLDTASADLLSHAIDAVGWWPDSAEAVVQLARRFVDREGSAVPLLADPTFRRFQLALAVAYRGHLREARTVFANSQRRSTTAERLIELAVLGEPRKDTKDVLANLTQERVWPPSGVLVALETWAARSDESALRNVARRADSLATAPVEESNRAYGAFLARAARGHLALARRDTNEALRQILALPDTACWPVFCAYPWLTAARLLTSKGRYQEAAQLIDIHMPGQYAPIVVAWVFERARAAEGLGDRERARRAYAYVADVWRGADPELQPVVAQARAGLARARAPGGF
jgi:serine/threonine-protein kinase